MASRHCATGGGQSQGHESLKIPRLADKIREAKKTVVMGEQWKTLYEWEKEFHRQGIHWKKRDVRTFIETAVFEKRMIRSEEMKEAVRSDGVRYSSYAYAFVEETK